MKRCLQLANYAWTKECSFPLHLALWQKPPIYVDHALPSSKAGFPTIMMCTCIEPSLQPYLVAFTGASAFTGDSETP